MLNHPITRSSIVGALTAVLLATGLGGCAWMYDKTRRAVATSSLGLAVIGNRLLTGKAVLYTDRSATLELSNKDEPPLSCMGTMNYTNSTGGVLDMRCNDGSQIRLPYTALSDTRGYATGGGVSITYGLPPENARAWLMPPEGRRLTVKKETGFMCDWFSLVLSCDYLQLQ